MKNVFTNTLFLGVLVALINSLNAQLGGVQNGMRGQGRNNSDQNTGTLIKTSAESQVGYTLFSPIGSKETYLINNDGEKIKSWISNYGPGLSAYLLPDGSLLRTANVNNSDFGAGGAGGRIERFASDGTLTWSYEISSSIQVQHHDIELLPNGNILVVVSEKKSNADAIAAGRDPSKISDGEIWSEAILEIEPVGSNQANIIWEWHAWDHLVQDFDPSQANYGVVAEHPELINLNYTQSRAGADWQHINSIDYHSTLDQIVLSVRNFSEIWVIDHSTTPGQAKTQTGGRSGKGGAILYRWGNPAAYNRGDTSDQTLFVQHDAEWIPTTSAQSSGDFLIFNNGRGRPDGNYSSVDQITPPLQSDGTYSITSKEAYGPSSIQWSYLSPADFYADHISGSQRLSNGNTLICEGTEGRVFEVKTNGEIVWEYSTERDLFRADRYDISYVSDSLTNAELILEEKDSDDESPSSGVDGETSVPSNRSGTYSIVDTGQNKTFNELSEIPAPIAGQAFFGQDAQYTRNPPNYSLDSTGSVVSDHVTGLMWTARLDFNNDGKVDYADKKTYSEAVAYAQDLNDSQFAGYNDWRLPTIKELYSLINFSGEDISGPNPDSNNLRPFIDYAYFDFAYGDELSGERLIDSQFASSTLYVSNVMNRQQAMFGLNLADGRIKGYPTSKKFNVYYVRGNTDYGKNAFLDNNDGTVSDASTHLMWAQNDSGIAMTWQQALAWVQDRNSENFLGYNDWRLPNAKELHSLVDYTRSPDTSGSAAIDPIFQITQIENEGGEIDYPWFWSSTTHINMGTTPGRGAVYICFGRAMGYMFNNWVDVHGAGAQRSGQKSEDLSQLTYIENGYYFARSPQGDATRVLNFVRLVRN